MIDTDFYVAVNSLNNCLELFHDIGPAATNVHLAIVGLIGQVLQQALNLPRDPLASPIDPFPIVHHNLRLLKIVMITAMENQSSKLASGMSSDELFAKYNEAANQRRQAARVFLDELGSYQTDTRSDSASITGELLEGFFDEELGKKQLVQVHARETMSLVQDFDQITSSISSSIMAMSLNLKRTHDVLAFEVIATPIREIGKSMAIEGRSPLEIAREGVDNITRARVRLNENYLSAIGDALMLEAQAEVALQQASVLLEIRRRHLWNFRRKHLSVSWREFRERIQREGRKLAKDEASEHFWSIIEDILKILSEEAEELVQWRRALRWGTAALRLFGKKVLNRGTNDTDHMMELLEQLRRENSLIEDLEATFERTATAIVAVRKIAQDSFAERQIN